jgi:hypothetical protein
MINRILAAFAIAAAAGPAVGGTAIADAEKVPQFSVVDVDDDGAISKAEAEAVPEIFRIFASVDKDRDGHLNTSEWTEAVARTQGLG